MAFKNLGNAGELFPQSVFIVATYDESGTPNAMNVAWGGECERHSICINIGSHQTLDNIIAKRAFTVSPADVPELKEVRGTLWTAWGKISVAVVTGADGKKRTQIRADDGISVNTAI